jgi:preprotein translocase subunit SecE
MASINEYYGQGKTFLSEVVAELKKVYWPPLSETRGFTAVVLIVVVFVSLYLGLVDWVLSRLMGFVF